MCRFIPQIDLESCEFLNFRFSVRSQPCPHCHWTNFVKAHGYVRASKEADHQPASSIRAVRFMCSARNGDSGCGRTLSIHWDHLVPRSSLESAQVSQIIETLIPHSDNMSLSEIESIMSRRRLPEHFSKSPRPSEFHQISKSPQSRRDAHVWPHSPEGTQAFSRQPGLAVPGTIDSGSSEGAQAEHASPTAPSPKKQFCPSPFRPDKPPFQDPTAPISPDSSKRLTASPPPNVRDIEDHGARHVGLPKFPLPGGADGPGLRWLRPLGQSP